MSSDAFSTRLLAWFDRHGRHDLPWQRNPTPYRVWVSEIMLQQTQVAAVIPYFERFTAGFPDLPALAAAPLDEVLALWAGLGYYARARNLHRAAKIVCADYGGELPRDIDALTALPGIGRSTAGAILALSRNQRHAILDGNVKRVLARYHVIDGWPGDAAIAAQLWAHAEAHTPAKDCARYTQAIMDLGATVCTRHKPRCTLCPQSADCAAYHAGRQGELPTPRARRTYPLRPVRMLVIEYDDAVLLEKRPPAGIWGGLWSLPELPPETAAAEWCESHLGLRIGPTRRLPPFTHDFTHFRLQAEPLVTEAVAAGILDSGRHRWYSGDAALALPAPIARFLAARQKTFELTAQEMEDDA